jgi:hypothetical protein
MVRNPPWYPRRAGKFSVFSSKLKRRGRKWRVGARRLKNVGVPTDLPGATANMRGKNSEVGRLVMLEEALRDSPRGPGEAGQGVPPGVFSVRIGDAIEKKRDGRKGVRKVRKCTAKKCKSVKA